MSRAVVTGAAGNIGKHLTAGLEARGWDVLAIDIKPAYEPGYLTADIRNPIDFSDRVREFAPEVIFHLASMVSRVTCEAAPTMAIETNLVGTQNVIEIAKTVGARLVYFSTSEVYGNQPWVLSEDGATNPNNRYGLSKLLGERLVEYEATNGLKAITLRPFMMYDEHEDFGDHRSAMIRFAVDLCLEKPIVVHEDSERGWFHSSDAIRAIISAGLYDGPYTVANIGSPDIRPMIDIARMIADEYDQDYSLIETARLPERMTLRKHPCLRRQSELLGVEPRVSTEEGIRLVTRSVRRRLGF